jgi:hypothetical protein
VGGDAASVRQLASLLEEYAAAWQTPCAFGRLAEDTAADFYLFGDEDEDEDNDNGIGNDNDNDNNHHQRQHRTRVWLDGVFPPRLLRLAPANGTARI